MCRNSALILCSSVSLLLLAGENFLHMWMSNLNPSCCNLHLFLLFKMTVSSYTCSPLNDYYILLGNHILGGERHKLLQLRAVAYISTQMCESSTNCEILVSSSTWERLSFTDANSALITCYKETDYRSAVRNSNTGPTHTHTHMPFMGFSWNKM